MRRPHRLAHRVLWPVLALLVMLGFTLALVWRPPGLIETFASGSNR